MKKCKKNSRKSLKLKTLGFTLVELLAVIVILAIILVIAVPQIMNVIKDTTKASFESSAKMVAAQVENQYAVAQTLNKAFANTGDCMKDWAGLNSNEYASCTYEITSDGKAKVTIEGSGKFKDLSVCNGTRSSAIASENGCTIGNFVTQIQNLYNNENTREENGLIKDNTVAQNIRYQGSNDVVKNYVEFGNTGEKWRIIGIFDVETSSGNIEKLVKLIREESIGNMSWDSSSLAINEGWGVNEWSTSDLNSMLNTYYLGISTNTCTYCDGWKEEICEVNCNSTVTPINSTYRNMIENVVWNTGAWDESIANMQTGVFNPVELYNAEKGNINSKICNSTNEDQSTNIGCTDTVERTTTWTGLVALPYITDWGYASSEKECSTNLWSFDVSTRLCKENNWMHFGTSAETFDGTWMLTPVSHPERASSVSIVRGDGLVGFGYGYSLLRVRPTIYLKSNLEISSGDGSLSNPYKLK